MLNTRDAAEGVREMLNRLRPALHPLLRTAAVQAREERTVKVELTGEADGPTSRAMVRAQNRLLLPPL